MVESNRGAASEQRGERDEAGRHDVPMRTLVFGERRASRLDVRRLLEARGHEVVAADDVEEAVALYERHHLLLLVLTSFSEEALKLCAAVHAGEAGRSPVVLAFVESEEREVLERVEASGVDDYCVAEASRERVATRLALVEQRAWSRERRHRAEATLETRAHQQAAVAALGQRALAGEPLRSLMEHAVEVVRAALDVSYCEILKYDAEEDGFVLEAGCGWDDDAAGTVWNDGDASSQITYTMDVGEPVLVEDVEAETRFELPPPLARSGVQSGGSVVIAGEASPYGVLGAHSVEHRAFDPDDVHFMQAVANVLANAIERRQTEQALQGNVARIRAILETTVDAIITIDARGHIESFNQAAERIFGYEADEVIGQNVKVLMPTPYREEHDSYIQSYHDTGRKRIIGIGREVVGRRKDGSIFPMDLAVSEVDLGERVIFTGIVRDITERRRLEQEILHISEQERRRIGQDLHDGLGQMLTGIGLLSQNLARRLQVEDHPEAETADEITALIKEADQHARGLARGLTPVDLENNGLVSGLQRLAVNAERLFDIRCTFEKVGEKQLHDSTTGMHLYRIAQEAVSNAVKHGKASYVKVTLALGSDQVRLRVQDNGIGFPQELDEEHRGMGVRIMHYRARIIGGVLDISAGVDGGTTVTCTVKHPEEPAHKAPVSSSSRTRSGWSPHGT